MTQHDEEQEATTNFGIGLAVSYLRRGYRVTRDGWNGKDMWLALMNPTPSPVGMTVPFVYMKTAQGHRVPWLCSQTDLLATDWRMLTDPAPTGSLPYGTSPSIRGGQS